MRLTYTLGIQLYGFAIRIYSLFNAKAKAWVAGRKSWQSYFSSEYLDGVWVHCASAGEFEQGRPVIEAIRKEYPKLPITLTFFSPSGYELRKTYTGADQIGYLPLDTSANATEIVKLINPKILVLVKYEIWHNLIHACFRQEVAVVLISAIFRRDQIYFRPWGTWFRKSLLGMRHIFTQNLTSSQLLLSVGVNTSEMAGDTRFDRVAEIAKNPPGLPENLKLLIINRFVVVAGSTWPKDDELLRAYTAGSSDNFLIIIAPHELQPEKLKRIKSEWPQAQLLSSFNPALTTKTVIIDQMGLLSGLYQLAKVAYIGGGFGAGIHNTLEAAVFGIPIIFGPNYRKFQEAKDLIDVGAAASVSDLDTLTQHMNQLRKDDYLRDLFGRTAEDYVRSKVGATQKIVDALRPLLIN